MPIIVMAIDLVVMATASYSVPYDGCFLDQTLPIRKSLNLFPISFQISSSSPSYYYNSQALSVWSLFGTESLKVFKGNCYLLDNQHLNLLMDLGFISIVEMVALFNGFSLILYIGVMIGFKTFAEKWLVFSTKLYSKELLIYLKYFYMFFSLAYWCNKNSVEIWN